MKNLPPFSLGRVVAGMALPFQGLRFFLANARHLTRYAVLPLVANIILYALAIGVLTWFLWEWKVTEVAWQFWGPLGAWVSGAINWMGSLVKLAIFMAALGASFFTFTAVGMALASPLNDILSEKVETIRTGGTAKASLPLHFTLRAALFSVWDSLRTLVKQLACTILSLPFLLVPVAGFLPLFLVGGYFAGFGYLDSAMARNFLRPRHKRLLVRAGFWEIMGFGMMMQALFAIPGVGMLLMPIGVVSGTLFYCRQDWPALLRAGGQEAPAGFVPPTPHGGSGAVERL